jgi:hypothetical protein
LEALAPAEARAVVLRYSWDDGVPYYELFMERLKVEGDSATWSCLLAVPKERAEVLYCLAMEFEDGRMILDEGGERFRARF